MYIDGFRRKSDEPKDEKINHFFAHEKEEVKNPLARLDETESKRADTEEADAPEEKMIAQHSEDVLFHWQAPEFETFEQDKRWLMYITLILVAIIAYAVYINSPIMAITFILIGVVGYIYIGKEPRVLDFMVTNDGVVAGNEIFEYEQIKSFWIFYEPEGIKVVSLHMNSYLAQYVHIPIHDEDPVKIREALMKNAREIKQDHNIVDTLERLLHI